MRLLATFMLLLVACSGNDLLEPCATSDDCASGLCLPARVQTGVTPDLFCSQPCAGDCPGGAACAAMEDDESYCVARCDRDVVSVLVCDAGVPIYCEVGGAELDCRVCACATAGRSACDVDTGECGPQRPVGSLCQDNAVCASANCGKLPGTTQGICFDEAGATCTDATCGSCDASNGASRCAQACASHADCDDGLWRCLRQGNAVQTYCRHYCDGTCPDGFTCEVVTDPETGTSGPYCFPG